MRITVYLVRHAECQSNVDHLFEGPEDSLTEKGETQVLAVANRLKDIPVDIVYTSTILRAVQTGAEIGRAVGVSPEVLDFIQETPARQNQQRVWEFRESFNSLMQRISKTKYLLEQAIEDRRHIVIVGHAIFFKALLARILFDDLLTPEFHANIQDVFVFENAGISTLVFNTDKKKWRIMGWNDTKHLYE